MTKARIQLLEEAGFSFNLYEETSIVKEGKYTQIRDRTRIWRPRALF